MKQAIFLADPLVRINQRITLGLAAELQRVEPWDVHVIPDRASPSHILKEFGKIRPDAVALLPVNVQHLADSNALDGIPTVCVWQKPRAFETLPLVRHSQKAIGKMAAEYLIEQRFQHIAIIYYEGTEGPRIQTFLDVVGRSGPNVHTLELSAERLGENPYTPMTTPPKVVRWLRDLPKPCAVFAHSDRTGAHLIRLCNLHSIRVPEDIAILGVDDDDLLCRTVSPNLASIHLPWFRLGTEAGRLLLDRRPGRHVIELPPTAVTERESVRQQVREAPMIRRALDYIRDSQGKAVRVRDLQALTGMNPQQLVYHFRAATGRTPMEEILRHRIHYAKLLLADTDDSTGRIAKKCGFKSSNRFYVNFQKQVRMSPGEYRAQFKRKS